MLTKSNMDRLVEAGLLEEKTADQADKDIINAMTAEEIDAVIAGAKKFTDKGQPVLRVGF